MTRKGSARPWLTGIALFFCIALLIAGLDLIYVWQGFTTAARSDGTLGGLAVQAPVQIVRDDRYIVHIRAKNEHDLYFAQGYAVAEDRLFQLELLKRYVRGRLAEWFGKSVLSADLAARTIDLNGIVNREWAVLDAHTKANIGAFSDGVNAAREREPLPVEFRILHATPEPWAPQDSLAAGFATVLDLIDPWDDVVRRARILHGRSPQAATILYQLTDPQWDAPVMGKPAPVPSLPPFASIGADTGTRTAQAQPAVEGRERGGSNNWAAGSHHTATGRALVASDPHLNGSMPGVWHIVDLEAPGLHVAGASLPGTPGVVLGHNETLAWGSTNGTTCSESLYDDPFEPHQTRTETFNVRFGGTVTHEYYRTQHGFVIAHDGDRAVAVDWDSDRRAISPLLAFDRLDRAHTIAQAREALRSYTGPSQNFVMGDTSGAVAYQLAGPVPNDPKWCLGIHAQGDPIYPILDMSALPHVAPSLDALVFTANAKPYGAGYPLRLTSNFTPPYRAAQVARALRTGRRFSVGDFVALQSNDNSIVETELTRQVLAAVDRTRSLPAELKPLVDALRSFNGNFDAASAGANAAFEVRRTLWKQFDEHVAGSDLNDYYGSANYGDLSLMMRALRENAPGWLPPNRDRFILTGLHRTLATWKPGQTWGEANAMTPLHPFALLGIHSLDGLAFPGRGDGYTIHVQSLPKHQQSYRAVWDVGRWESGGMSIPSGESGQPGSAHYTDLTGAWNANAVATLPFDDAAVEAAAKHRLVLTP